MEFRGPSLEKKSYRSKFVRAGEHIHVTAPADERTPHKVLAQADGILSLVEELRQSNPVEVDAGIIFVDTIDATLRIDDYSTTLDLPVERVAREARMKTQEIFRAKSQGYTVS